MSWTLKRNDDNSKIELHEQLWWIDEYDWTPLAQSDPVYTVTGSMNVQQGTKKAGRTITLDSTYAKFSREQIKTLQTWASVPELTLTLTHPNGQDYRVIFARPAISDIQAMKPMKPADEDNDDWYQAKLHFLTI